MSARLVGWLLVIAAIAGAGWWLRSVIAERDALRAELDALTAQAAAETARLKAERDRVQASADAASAELAKAMAAARAVTVVRTVRVPAPAGLCKPDSSASAAAPGGDRPPATSEPDQPRDTGVACFRSADYEQWRQAVEGRLAEYRAQHEAHRRLSEVVAALPCVRVQ